MTIDEKAKLRAIVNRRFGSRHDKPCVFPTVVTCAAWECQKLNRCQHAPNPPTDVSDAKGGG